jgi:hypothetical protein
MDTFAASQSGVKKARRKVFMQTTPLMILALAAPLGILYFRGMTGQGLMILLPLLGFIFYRAHRRSTRQLDETFSSFRIILDGDTLIRRQSGLEDIAIQRNEVTAIYESPAGGLAVRTNVRSKFLGVPAFLERYEELRDHLSSWQPIIERRFPVRLATYGSTLGVLALFGTFLLSQGTAVVVASGVLLFLGIVVSSIYIRRSPHIEQRVKKQVWAFVLVLLMIIVRIYLVLR